ncbi:arsenate reductase (glutaredoxin) [Ulvibacter antarcticus]|uniref:Arsenate reductase n=1 Tax=Ulvibacter antarcticus TaxID=442714 RepID=A0A3L9ZD33_9FLAO|nr:arsenate reductase (glutaredoxin) [Ulvibacter antarcticus]RMA64562.1 arsenate reductase [Ulvibacter antarcticus]
MITIYHNNRCSKSRECFGLLEDKKIEMEVINYLQDPISEEKLREIITLLGIAPIILVRKNEAIWKENFKGKNMSDEDVIKAMLKYPKLMERPIVINGKKAVIGRPPVKVLEIL